MSEPSELDTWLAEQEAAVPGLRPGCARRIRWAGVPGARSDLALIYLHGFSASPVELRPLPDRVAAALGANLYFARLTGHGCDAAALGAARLEDWQRDVTEALQLGRRLGRRLLLMGCSTGCTLAVLAMAEGAEVAGAIQISPNYALYSKLRNAALQAPGVERWGARLFGAEHGFTPVNEAHAAYWTCRFPTSALLPMGEALKRLRRADLGGIAAPTLFVYCEADRVVDPQATERAFHRWGGPAERRLVDCGPGDDPAAHVIAGDVLSPGLTGQVAEHCIVWARRHL